MNYNPLIDLALMGATLIILGLILRVTHKKPTGATRMDSKHIRMMQRIRRAENGL
jgi:hypothetical protein